MTIIKEKFYTLEIGKIGKKWRRTDKIQIKLGIIKIWEKIEKPNIVKIKKIKTSFINVFYHCNYYILFD